MDLFGGASDGRSHAKMLRGQSGDISIARAAKEMFLDLDVDGDGKITKVTRAMGKTSFNVEGKKSFIFLFSCSNKLNPILFFVWHLFHLGRPLCLARAASR